jgi:hypothetical protein
MPRLPARRPLGSEDQAVLVLGIPVVRQQVGKATWATDGQRVGRTVLAVVAQDPFGVPPRLVTELRQMLPRVGVNRPLARAAA